MRVFQSASKALFIALLAVLAGCAQNTSSLDDSAIADIRNIRQPEEQVFSSGQPTAEQFNQMAASGIKHVINLRPRSEQADFDEASVVQALGMTYHTIPVAGIADVTPQNAATLDQLLQTLDGPVLVHCASGNRVGALRALTASENGMDVDAALADGARWGLTGMADGVRGVISE